MPHHYFRLGPFGFSFWGPEWYPEWEYGLLDVERTADEVIITLRIPRDVKKEEVKVEFKEGRVRVRVPRKPKGGWEEIPVE